MIGGKLVRSKQACKCLVPLLAPDLDLSTEVERRRARWFELNRPGTLAKTLIQMARSVLHGRRADQRSNG